MEFVHEVTAYLENKPGRLAKICSALAHEKMDIRALSVMDANGRSVLRLVTDELEPTKQGADLAGHRDSGRRGPGRRDGATGPARSPASWSGSPRSTSTSSTPTSRTPRRPGRSLGIFHTSNPKRAQQVLTDTSGSVRRQTPAATPAPCPLTTGPDPAEHLVDGPAPRRPGRARDRGQRRRDRPDLRRGRGDALAGPPARLPPRRPPSPPRGLDYWEHLDWRVVDHLDEVVAALGRDRLWSFSTRATGPYTEAAYRPGDALVFGPESRGLPGRLARRPGPTAPSGSRSGPRPGA